MAGDIAVDSDGYQSRAGVTPRTDVPRNRQGDSETARFPGPFPLN
jgi:hypothetical protein